MTARRAGTTAVAAVVATTVVVLVLSAWAASIGPSDVLNGPGPSPVGTPTGTATTASAAPRQKIPQQKAPHHPPAWMRVAAFLVNVAIAVLGVYLLVRYVAVPVSRWTVARRTRRRARRDGPAGEPEFAVLRPADAVAQAMLEDAEAQRAALLGAESPRNAVVACWHRFETQAAEAGVPRHDWETSSEYTMRVLDLVDAHQPAVSRLGVLYREARFSEHEVTEAHRQEALAALDAIHRTIGIPA